MKSWICLALILLPLFSVVEGHQFGSPRLMKIDEETIVMAKFAIAEHNRQAKKNLVYVNVVQETMQIVAGVLYRLIIAAKNGRGAVINHEAFVWDKLDSSRTLVSFRECMPAAYVKRFTTDVCTPVGN
ncbi:unnamed protein product [Eruca vesicaria subsp. sativa]|uniref:Cystatin domain-containing protein n=1 Tax=Eruca vesicaria subsp. sativa TaxID=29727 RepID=A0ABC8JRS4_ERUVS|nr:unnamed protein product [Eruca vesicaria subsp. sativa]